MGSIFLFDTDQDGKEATNLKDPVSTSVKQDRSLRSPMPSRSRESLSEIGSNWMLQDPSNHEIEL